MDEVRRSTDGVEVLPRSKRDWQIWLMLILVFALMGMGMAVYGFLSKPAAGASAGDVLEFVPPLLFGVLALFLLSGFYLAQKEAVLRALREEVLTQKIEAELNRELLAWEQTYNTIRPHQALGYLTPLEFLTQSSPQRKEPMCH